MSYYDSGEKEYAAVPEGQYEATLVDVSPNERDGVPTLSFQYKLDNNRRVFQNFSFNEKGKKWITWQLGILGLNAKAAKLAKGVDEPAAASEAYLEASTDLFNAKVTLEITHNAYQGSTYERVKLVSFDCADSSVGHAPKSNLEEEHPF